VCDCHFKESPEEQLAMDPLEPNTGVLPPALRALALGLLVETVVPLLHNSREENSASADRCQGRADGQAELRQALRSKCGELSALVLRSDDPGEAATYVLGYLPKHFEYVFELIHGQKRRLVLGDLEAAWKDSLREDESDSGAA
jgi:hypothetical protein